MADPQATKFLRLFLKAAERQAKPKIPSTTLRRALQKIIDPGQNQGFLEIPHYWAVYVHDGRGPFGPRRGRFLVWWKNPAEDPRFPGRQTPARRAGVRKLTPDEFWDAQEEVAEASRAGQESPVVIVRQVRGTTPATDFFLNTGGMAGFVNTANKIGKQKFRKLLFQRLKGVLTKGSFVPRGGVVSVQAIHEEIRIPL